MVLASSSRYRRDLLKRILPNFTSLPPGVDESALPGESAAAMSIRLARLKAESQADKPDVIVIGSDQVAELDGSILGKPGSAPKAIEQLLGCSGRWLTLHSAVCVIDGASRMRHEHVDITRLLFRELSARTAARYVARDNPIDCAGSFKFESLGITLFQRVETEDPTAIQGLPLIWLSDCLQRLGVPIL